MATEAVRLIIITVPPSEISEEIDAFRRTIARIGDTREALTYPPHITMRTGALVPPGRLEEYADRFERHLAGISSFLVETDALEQSTYEADGGRRHFVGYGIVRSGPLLELNARLLGFRDWIKSNRTDFYPHLTVAFHDLDGAGAARIAQWIIDNPSAVPSGFMWTCNSIGLWSRGEERWEPVRIAKFLT